MDQLEDVRERLDRYRDQGLAEVQGWFEPESAELMADLLLHQLDLGLGGGVAEIGVHHGRSFLLLANGLGPGESAVALDVFEHQEQNTDHSGRGDRGRFEDNLERWAPGVPVAVVARSSLDVSVEDAREVFGRPRMFSVDGGHTAEITRHDLELAEASLGEGGVVVLDDMLNGHWLGVLTGTATYLLDQPRLVPFALSPNKLYLADTPEAARDYAEHLRSAVPDLLGKRDVEFFGTTVDVYGQGAPRHRQAAAPAATLAAALTPDLRSARAVARRAQREAASLADQLAELHASHSWRATAPLRVVGRLVRRP
ncbi:class I SAM-dependent methyltransferase [Nocardioides currus]|uniref:Class I SAM-dependent methyltransferase n=1 Tax=Nocardioides currus TaxID=2133958 RepID=A0A2R7YUA7_9ACTN|nr:class I SAM-dependent methyltransferase [Nocardioides currus]PUA79666.1 class I SAM-dependent methyltransferase [Nocardioides currus]